MSVLYKSDPVRGPIWAQVFAEQAPDVEFHIWPDHGDPRRVEYLVAWAPPPESIVTFPNVKVLFSSGAGVDQPDLASVPAHIRVVRMVEPGIVQGVVASLREVVEGISKAVGCSTELEYIRYYQRR
jgi:glyoxylate/hydroxypyruvate reductase